MKKIIRILVLTIQLIALTSIAKTQGTIDQILWKDKITHYLNKGISNGFAGSVLISKNGQIILNDGFGMADKEKAFPNTPNTIFDIGSNSKQFTGAAILKLEEQKKLHLSDPLHLYFDNLPKEKKDITIHQLLTHTGGFQESIGSDFEEISTPDFFNSVFKSKLVNQPGADFNYSNIGYSVLARVIEIVSDMEYEKFLNETFFKPLGMNQTGYLIPKWKKKNIAIGYNRNIMNMGSTVSRYQEKSNVSWHLKGNGGINSTHSDILKWIQAIKSQQLLSKDLIEKWTTPYVKEINNYYGYGWGIYASQENGKVICHNGGNGAFSHSIIWYSELDILIIFATNASSPYVENIAYEIEKIIFNKNYKPDPIKKNPYLLVVSFIEERKTSESIFLFTKLKKEYSEVLKKPETLNRLGYMALRNDNVEWAIELFGFNAILFPDNGNLWDSLGEAYANNKQKAEAVKCLKIALELAPENDCSWCNNSNKLINELTKNR